MRAKNYICCLLVLVVSSTANAQWIKQDLGTISSLMKVYFKNDDVGFIVGLDYTMFKTVDGGQTWNLQALPINTSQSDMIVDIHFPTEDIGYALPNLKSIDGGITWDTVADFGYPSYYNGIYFIDELRGFTLGYKTIDGGVNWELINLTPNGSPRTDVLFINDSIGFITAVYHSGIWKTTDAGNTWEAKDLMNNIREVTFASDSVGYALGAIWEGLRKTTDQGETWTDLNVTDAIGMCISCPEENTCYVNSTDGIMKTIDGGLNWFVQDSSVKNIKSIYCFDANSCIAVGDSGKVYRTINGGGPVGVSEIDEDVNRIKIFPNPFVSSTVIEFENKNQEDHTLNIYNSTGQLVRKIEDITTGKIKIERENLLSGFYVFRLMNNVTWVGAGKIIVE